MVRELREEITVSKGEAGQTELLKLIEAWR